MIRAYASAVTIDVAQFLLGPLGWAGADEILDAVAMVLTWRLIGFHPLLLPTFVLELVPFTDMLPTWTGCVALVVALRKRQQAASDQQPHSQRGGLDQTGRRTATGTRARTNWW